MLNMLKTFGFSADQPRALTSVAENSQSTRGVCSHITDIGVGYLSTMTSLSRLYLRWCTQLRDFGLQHLYTMKSLTVLSLAGCSSLTATGLTGLIQLRGLQELELTNCPGATPEVCKYLKDNMATCLLID